MQNDIEIANTTLVQFWGLILHQTQKSNLSEENKVILSRLEEMVLSDKNLLYAGTDSDTNDIFMRVNNLYSPVLKESRNKHKDGENYIVFESLVSYIITLKGKAPIHLYLHKSKLPIVKRKSGNYEKNKCGKNIVYGANIVRKTKGKSLLSKSL